MPSEQHENETSNTGIPSGPDRVRAEVIKAARRLFAEKGIHAVSVREIAREVGVSHTLLHLYFGSKEEIVRRVLAEYDAEMTVEINEHTDFAQAIGDAFRATAANRDVVRVLAAALVENIVPDELDTSTTTPAAMMSAIATRSQLPGATDNRILAFVLISAVMGWTIAGDWLVRMLELGEMDSAELDEAVAQLLERFARDCA